MENQDKEKDKAQPPADDNDQPPEDDDGKGEVDSYPISDDEKAMLTHAGKQVDAAAARLGQVYFEFSTRADVQLYREQLKEARGGFNTLTRSIAEKHGIKSLNEWTLDLDEGVIKRKDGGQVN